MAGRVQWEAQVDSNVAKLLKETKDLRDQLDGIKKGNYEIKLNIDNEKLEKVISNLDKMLNSLGKGTGDFKEFENLSKQLNEIVSEVKELNKAFSGINDSGVSNLLSSIQSIDKSLSSLSEHITNVNKDFGSVGKNASDNVGQINEAKKATEGLAEATKELANAQKNAENITNVQDKITDQIVENEERKQKAYKATADAVMYHAGVISKLNKAETNGRFYGSNRGTGYFGTGHYFVDSATKHELDNNSSYSKLPYTSIDISQYDNLFKATTNELASGLHNFLENLTRFTQGSDSNTVSELFSQFQKVFGETVMDMQEFDATSEKLKVFMQNSSMEDRSDSVSTQFMKSLGYGGVDTRGTRYADTRYGTVIYDLKEESILQSNITDELQKQGQMLEKINYEKGQAFDQKEDTRLQGILDQQARAKEVNAEFDKLFDSTKVKQLESELASVNDTLRKNEEIIADCQKGISNAEAEARKFAKGMKSIGLDVPESEIEEQANRYRSGYQERIDELQKERPLLEARRQELEENLNAEYKLANAAKERARAIVEERHTPIKDTFQGDAKASADSSTPAIKDEAKAMERVAESAEKASKGKDEFAKANKKVKDSADSSSKAVNEEKISLSSMQKEIDKYNKRYKDFNRKPTDANRSSNYQSALNDYKASIDELQKFYNALDNSTPITTEQLSKWKELTATVDVASDALKAFSAAEKGSTEGGRWKEIDKISKYLEKNTKISKEARQQLEHYLDLLKSGSAVNIEEIHMQFNKIAEAERRAGREGKSFFDIITDKAVYGAAAQLAGYYLSLTDFIRYAQNGVQTIREFDTALTEMRKVSDETVSSLERFQDVSFDLADGVGTTAKQIQNSTADWMRLGEAMSEASESAQVSNILLNVSEFEGIDEATESLVSMSQAYKDLEKIEIVDTLNKLGNEYAISTDGLATALKDSASALKTAQNDFYEASALAVSANTVVQDPSKVGAGLRTISLRLTGTEAARKELEELGEDVSDFQVTTTSKLNQQIMDLTRTQDGLSVSLLDMNGNYRSTYEILLDIAKVWDKIAEEDLATGENRQNALLEMMAGRFCLKFVETHIYRTHLTALIA